MHLFQKKKAFLRLLENRQDHVADWCERCYHLFNMSVTAISGYTVEEAIGLNMAKEVYYHIRQRDGIMSGGDFFYKIKKDALPLI